MVWIHDPAWAEYKAALARIAKTGARLERAYLQGSPNLGKAEQAYQNALEAYAKARSQLTCSPDSKADGLAHNVDPDGLDEDAVPLPEDKAERPRV
jgi:phage terminase small subunit